MHTFTRRYQSWYMCVFTYERVISPTHIRMTMCVCIHVPMRHIPDAHHTAVCVCIYVCTSHIHRAVCVCIHAWTSHMSYTHPHNSRNAMFLQNDNSLTPDFRIHTHLPLHNFNVRIDSRSLRMYSFTHVLIHVLSVYIHSRMSESCPLHTFTWQSPTIGKICICINSRSWHRVAKTHRMPSVAGDFLQENH